MLEAEELRLSASQTTQLRQLVEQLEKEARLGKRYLEGLRQEAVRLGVAAHPQMSRKALERMAQSLDEEELRQFGRDCSSLLDKRFSPVVQLAPSTADKTPAGEDPFKI